MEHDTDQKELNDRVAKLEAFLFIHGEPLTHEKIGKVLGFEKKQIEHAAEELKKRLQREDRGLTLVVGDKKMQLMTKPHYSGILEKFVKEELTEELTPASLETLSIIGYLGPLSRARIEYLRGVNSSFILRSLLMRGLVERLPDPTDAHTYLYQPSFTLIKYLGLTSQNDLPEFERYRTFLQGVEEQQGEPQSAETRQKAKE